MYLNDEYNFVTNMCCCACVPGWAHASPKEYTRMLSHLMVTVELAAMITPIIALGKMPAQELVLLCVMEC